MFDTVLMDPFNEALLISAMMLVPSFSLNALLIVLEMVRNVINCSLNKWNM